MEFANIRVYFVCVNAAHSFFARSFFARSFSDARDCSRIIEKSTMCRRALHHRAIFVRHSDFWQPYSVRYRVQDLKNDKEILAVITRIRKNSYSLDKIICHIVEENAL